MRAALGPIFEAFPQHEAIEQMLDRQQHAAVARHIV